MYGGKAGELGKFPNNPKKKDMFKKPTQLASVKTPIQKTVPRSKSK